MREFALRALTDRKKELAGLDAKPFVAALADESPRVRAAGAHQPRPAQRCIGREEHCPAHGTAQGSAMPTKKPVHAQPDPDRVIPHLAVRALVALNAIDACLEALDGPHGEGRLWAMRYMHDKKTVDGLIKKLAPSAPPNLRRDILATLIRLYHREADYKGRGGASARRTPAPTTTRGVGPEQADRRGRHRPPSSTATRDTVAFLKTELARHQVSLAGLPTAPRPSLEKEKPGRGAEGRPEQSQPDRQHDLRGRRQADTGRQGRRHEGEGAIQVAIVRRLPHRRRRADA